jgi:Uncharacterised nucleotidyltransferase
VKDTDGTRDPAGRPERPPWDPFRAAVLGLAIDRAAAEAVVALRDAGVRSIILKGPSFDAWLYDSDEPRLYGDVDVLIPAPKEAEAGRVLEGLGYRQLSDREPEAVAEHATVWARPRDSMHVDLHRTLNGVAATGVDLWDVLAADTASMQVGGTVVEILSEPARALHVALHAALPGANTEKTLLDLSRALDRLPPATWEAAAALAGRLGAEAAFETGLSVLPAGADLAATLGLAPERSVEAALLAGSAPYSAWTVNRLSKAQGLRARLRILLPRLFPKPDFMRVWYPVARRGRAGLVLAYLRRLAWLVTATPGAVRAWRRASRETRDSAQT